MRVPNQKWRSVLIWALMFFVLIGVWQFFNQKTIQVETKNLSFDEFVNAVKTGQIKEVAIAGAELAGDLKDGKKFIAYKEYGFSLTPLLLEHKVPFRSVYAKEAPWWISLGTNLLVAALVIGGILIFMRYAGKLQSKSMTGGTPMKKYNERKMSKVTFADVAGIDEAKEELGEIVEFLKNTDKFGRLGGRVPKGVLLMGSPGTGKTLLARAVAGEADVPFLWMSGSEFVEMFVGVGASRARELFSEARKKAPCVIFLDELDAIAKQRGAGLGQNHNENEQTLNQILVEMDGFEKGTGVIVIAATNRPDVLDSAILRPGRFDRQVTVPRPDLKGRYEILKVHARGKEIRESVDLMIVARGTPGASGADLENLCNEAALAAERKNKDAIGQEDFEEAFEKISLGKERPLIISEKERRVIACHEAGHVIVIFNQSGSDPLYKVSIIPRGVALGVTLSLPIEDKFLMSKTQLADKVRELLGGRAAEKIMLGDITDGASNDLERATSFIKHMITKCGMDKEIGMASFGDSGASPFLGRSLAFGSGMSQEMQYKVEQRTNVLLDEYYAEVEGMLEAKKDDLLKLTAALLERETLSADEIKRLLNR